MRQSLIMENKTGKYFKYAVGEIVLVVIGILIALQINNWNENRKDANKEKAILADIHDEFKKNKKQLDSVVDLHKMSYDYCGKIMAHFPIDLQSKDLVLDSLSVWLFDSYGGVTFDPSQSSINALTNTSSFDIISNEKLRKLLISWNDLIKDYQEEEVHSKNNMAQQYDPYMSKHFDFDFDFRDQRNDFNALRTLEFEYLVKNRHYLLGEILNRSGELQKVQFTLNEIITLSNPQNNN